MSYELSQSLDFIYGEGTFASMLESADTNSARQESERRNRKRQNKDMEAFKKAQEGAFTGIPEETGAEKLGLSFAKDEITKGGGISNETNVDAATGVTKSGGLDVGVSGVVLVKKSGKKRKDKKEKEKGEESSDDGDILAAVEEREKPKKKKQKKNKKKKKEKKGGENEGVLGLISAYDSDDE